MDFENAFNRALSYSFCKRKFLLVFSVLSLCGLLAVFFRGLSDNAHSFVVLNLSFLPIFICSGLLMSLGVILIRAYHHEVKSLKLNYKELIASSWEIIIGTTYLSVPFLLLFLVLWMFLGFFFFLREIPAVGPYISVVLSFCPFLLIFFAMILSASNILLLYFMTPLIALKSELKQTALNQLLWLRLRANPLANIRGLVLSLTPMVVLLFFLLISAYLTGVEFFLLDTTAHVVMQWFFIMLPFSALMTPAVIFFFNFAAEAHVLHQKERRLRT